MLRRITVYFLFAIILFLSGCAGMIRNLNEDWASKNRVIAHRLGERSYDGLNKTKAMNAMVVALQRLGLTITSAEYQVGILTATAPAPSPLTAKEMEIVESAENDNAQRFVPGLMWNFNDFESDLSASFLEYKGGVQMNLGGKLKFVGNKISFIPVNQFPPKGLEIAFNKIWEEFEKIAFIQNKTLK